MAYSVLLTLVLLITSGAPLGAQEGSSADDDARIARADSIRATLVQPPGDRDGVTAMDVVRAPFQVVGGVMALGLTAGVALYEAFDETGVLDVVLDARGNLSDAGVQVDPDLLGTRSWPALVVTWDGIDPFYLRAGYSLRHYELYAAGFELGDDGLGGRVSGSHHVLRQPHFWGVGPDSDASDRSDFELTRTGADAHAWVGPAESVVLTFGGGWERNVVGRGHDDARPDLQDVFDPEELFGTGRTEFARLGVDLDVDLTAEEELQPRGVRLLAGYRSFRGTDETDADFHRATMDLATFLPVWRRHAFALRLLGTDHFAEEGEGVPFTHLAELGDDDGLRGYRSRRFHDGALLAAQAEWRWETWWHPGDPGIQLQGFVFVDYGAIGPSVGAIDSGDFDLTPGLGLRLFRDFRGVAEGYVAWGGEDAPRFDASLGVTF